MVDLLVIMVVNVALIVFLTTFLYARRYKRVPVDQAMIVYGRRRGDRAFIVIGPGGGKFIVPIVEQFQYMSLAIQTLRLSINKIATRSGVPLRVDFVAKIRISSERTKLDAAAQAWPSKAPTAIADMAEETIAACARSIGATMEVEQVISDLDAFGAIVRESASPVLGEVGLEIIALIVRDFGDEIGYIDALQVRSEALRKEAAEATQAATKAYASDPARKARLQAIFERVASMSDEDAERLLRQLEARKP